MVGSRVSDGLRASADMCVRAQHRSPLPFWQSLFFVGGADEFVGGVQSERALSTVHCLTLTLTQAAAGGWAV